MNIYERVSGTCSRMNVFLWCFAAVSVAFLSSHTQYFYAHAIHHTHTHIQTQAHEILIYEKSKTFSAAWDFKCVGDEHFLLFLLLLWSFYVNFFGVFVKKGENCEIWGEKSYWNIFRLSCLDDYIYDRGFLGILEWQKICGAWKIWTKMRTLKKIWAIFLRGCRLSKFLCSRHF